MGQLPLVLMPDVVRLRRLLSDSAPQLHAFTKLHLDIFWLSADGQAEWLLLHAYRVFGIIRSVFRESTQCMNKEQLPFDKAYIIPYSRHTQLTFLHMNCNNARLGGQAWKAHSAHHTAIISRVLRLSSINPQTASLLKMILHRWVVEIPWILHWPVVGGNLEVKNLPRLQPLHAARLLGELWSSWIWGREKEWGERERASEREMSHGERGLWTDLVQFSTKNVHGKRSCASCLDKRHLRAAWAGKVPSNPISRASPLLLYYLCFFASTAHLSRCFLVSTHLLSLSLNCNGTVVSLPFEHWSAFSKTKGHPDTQMVLGCPWGEGGR